MNIKKMLAQARAELTAADIDTSPLDSRVLLAYALGTSVEHLIAHPEETISPEIATKYEQLIKRRCQREPVAYLVGTKEFWGYEFLVTKDVLIPRPDSETLIEAVLADFTDKNALLRILDLGTGSGCLLLALLKEFPHAKGVGIDKSPAVLAVASANVEKLNTGGRVEWLQGNWIEPLEKKEAFDIVVCNPPYIPASDIAGLSKDVVVYEPHSALDGGVDGLDDYKKIIPQLHRVMAEAGYVYFEVGMGQAVAVSQLLARSGFSDIHGRKDLAGIERCVMGAISNPR